MSDNNKCSKKNKKIYVIGSVALAVGAMLVLPKVIDALSEKFYTPEEFEDNDDWGPEIVKKEKAVEEETDGEL